MKKFVQWFTLSLLIVSGRSAMAQDVLTQHNDLARTGWNPNETTLTTNNVNSNTFGLAYTLPVDDKIYAQPLVVNGVNISGVGIKNIVYVATVNNTIYAYDADVAGAYYWMKNYTNVPLAGSRPAHSYTDTAQNPQDMHPSLCNGFYYDFQGNMGIIGTPVIDKPNGTMYFVTKIVNGNPDNHPWSPTVHLDEYTYGTSEFHQYLHAVDITNGAEKPGSPVEITATANGTGDGQSSGTITFDPRRNFNRSGLALSNGIIYIAYAAHCDFNPSHGWLLGYNSTSLTRQLVYITTPNDGRGGIWMSGSGPAIDANGSIYFTTGNSLDEQSGQVPGQGTQYNIYNSDPANPANRGESVIKLTPNTQDNTATTFTLSDYFTPFNYMELNDFDLDFPIQTILIPNTNMVITGCKDDSLYVLDRTNLGGFNPTINKVLQTKFVGDLAEMHSSFAYFGGTAPLLYQFSENTALQAFPVLATSLGTPAVNGGLAGPTGPSGGYMSVSSNGIDPATGILWISHSHKDCDANSGNCPIVLRAVKANDITNELWNSYINGGTDSVGLFSKMVCPTITNGKVYEPTTSRYLAVYGLKTNTTCVTNVALGKTATASSQNGSASNVTDGNTTTSWTSNGTDNQNIYVDMGSRYDFCRVMINWQNTNALNFIIDVSEDAIAWTNVDSVVNNASTTTDFFGSFTGRYVRMRGKNRAGAGGYSINEFQIFGQPGNPCAPPANLTVPNPTPTSAVLNWNAVFGAAQYLVQYKPRVISSWISRTVTTNSATLTALSCGTTYDYKVQTICGGSAQSTTSSGGFISGSCTGGCNLLTRYFNSDIGDIGVGGSACLNSGIYTIKGSGTDIGGTDDQFQYVFTSTQGDNQAAAQVLTQDQVSASDKAGVMIRDSLTNTSRFAYMASMNGGTNIVFIYRSVPGGPTTTVPIAGNVTFPYWIKVGKVGTQFAPFTSTDGVTWAQASPAVNLNFGTDINDAPEYGMAVTSANNTLLSTAQLGSFSLTANSTPLPIQLASFTAQNINNDHVLVSWSTSMEENVDHFEVQKSADGNSYQTFTTVRAAGNSQTLLNYSVQDNQPQVGINYYRLEEVDSDGKTSFSPVVTVEFGKSVSPALQPNPATSYTNVVSKSEPILEVTLYDILGKELRKIKNTNGAATVRINTVTLGTGVYIVRIKTAGKIYEQKLFKQ